MHFDVNNFHVAKDDAVVLTFFKQIGRLLTYSSSKALVYLRAMTTRLNFFRLELQFLLRCLE